jgi:signal transduction histidine kinase
MIRRLFRWILPTRIASQIITLLAVSLVAQQLLLTAVALFAFRSLEDPFRLQSPYVIRTVTAFQILEGMKSGQSAEASAPFLSKLLPLLRAEKVPHPSATKLEGWTEDAIGALNEILGAQYSATGFIDADGKERVQLRTPSAGLFSLAAPTGDEFPLPQSLLATLLYGPFGIVMFLTVGWAAWRIVKPLSRLASAAAQFDADKPHVDIAETGPSEVRKVSRAFNEMGRRTSGLVEDRTKMIAAVSHDLRTPITRMRLRAEYVEDPTHRHALLDDLQVMDKMIQSALMYMRDLKLVRAPEFVDLTSLVQTLCDSYLDMGAPIAFEAPYHCIVICDPDQITRAVSNVIENAIKHGTVVNVRLTESLSGTVDIIIEDDGPGVPDAEKFNLLEPFHRGDASRSSQTHEGFGLGLSIANVVADAHGGKLSLENAEPSGLLVRIRLPRYEEGLFYEEAV